VVDRHQVRQTAADRMTPLTVGNGEVAFTVDVTGLQTFPDFHDPASAAAAGTSAMPLCTQAQWGFHSTPNPAGWSLDDVAEPYSSAHGEVRYPTRFDFRKERADLSPDDEAGYWLWVNPHRLDLARVGLELRARPGGPPAQDISEVQDVDQRLDLWEGLLHSRFRHADSAYSVTTVCHPDEDVVAVRVASPALRDGRATVTVDFPFASDTFGGTADWSRPDAHTTVLVPEGPSAARWRRTLDADGYEVRGRWTPGAQVEHQEDHRYRLSAAGLDAVEVVLRFSADHDARELPTFAETVQASARGWSGFWGRGAAVDLAGSTDPRAAELERRVVLSQYVTATQCAGSHPSAETGLVQNSWAGKFHLEMHWWHAAHFAAWGRPDLLERSFRWYLDALPSAQRTARQQGYAGARWPKHVGPEARESPNEIGPLLVWQQPHPIHLAELLRRSDPERAADVLATYGELVEETARFIASFLVEGVDGRVHLDRPLMPAQETYDPREVLDPTFELAYFHWGLSTAQEWRVLRGRERRRDWDDLLDRFAGAPCEGDGYAAVGGPPRTTLTDHPSLLCALGLVPPTPVIDPVRMSRTLHRVVRDWEWDSAWGWDFPVLALCATRLGEPRTAVDALLMDTARNTYLANGHNCQDPVRLPLYLPGNGGLLAAVALMAAGESGHEAPAPGFPADGSWVVRAEGFPARP